MRSSPVVCIFISSINLIYICINNIKKNLAHATCKRLLLPHANSQIHKIVMGMQHPLNYVIPYTAVIKSIPLMPGAK